MKNSLLCSTFLSISEFKLDEKFVWNASLYTKSQICCLCRAFIRSKNKVDQKIWKQQLCDVFMCKYKICHILKHSLELFFKPTHIWLPLEFYYYIILLWWLTKFCILHTEPRLNTIAQLVRNWKKSTIQNFSVQLNVYLLK